MEKKESSVPPSSPLFTIRKIKQTDSETHVNQLLSRGWVLLALETKGDSHMGQYAIFTLGHTDPLADDSFKYTQI